MAYPYFKSMPKIVKLNRNQFFVDKIWLETVPARKLIKYGIIGKALHFFVWTWGDVSIKGGQTEDELICRPFAAYGGLCQLKVCIHNDTLT